MIGGLESQFSTMNVTLPPVVWLIVTPQRAVLYLCLNLTAVLMMSSKQSQFAGGCGVL